MDLKTCTRMLWITYSSGIRVYAAIRWYHPIPQVYIIDTRDLEGVAYSNKTVVVPTFLFKINTLRSLYPVPRIRGRRMQLNVHRKENYFLICSLFYHFYRNYYSPFFDFSCRYFWVKIVQFSSFEIWNLKWNESNTRSLHTVW